jgi:hypothetical protein
MAVQERILLPPSNTNMIPWILAQPQISLADWRVPGSWSARVGSQQIVSTRPLVCVPPQIRLVHQRNITSDDRSSICLPPSLPAVSLASHIHSQWRNYIFWGQWSLANESHFFKVLSDLGSGDICGFPAQQGCAQVEW